MKKTSFIKGATIALIPLMTLAFIASSIGLFLDTYSTKDHLIKIETAILTEKILELKESVESNPSIVEANKIEDKYNLLHSRINSLQEIVEKQNKKISTLEKRIHFLETGTNLPYKKQGD